MSGYDPRSPDLRRFHDAIPAFLDGLDSPRDYLERCLETIEAREPEVKAFVVTNIEGAREAADRSSERYRRNRPLSAVDGMPVCIKDLYETVDMPTQMNSPVYEGWQSIRDAAHVHALRRGGAGIVGKTVTTEFGQATPGPTRNPFDPARTPGGSSSGTAAAVGAGMVPAGSGSQVRGSIQRPAGYCGNYALKPTFGALNRGGGHSMAPSQSVLGVHAGSLEDCWRTAFHISATVGGDPGQPGLFGRPELERAVRPGRLARLDTRAWPDTEGETREVFERFVSEVAGHGVEIVSRAEDERVEALEEALTAIPDFMFDIFAYEMRWPTWGYRDMEGDLLSEAVLERLARGERLSPEDYRDRLAMRDELRRVLAALDGAFDGYLTLSAKGPPPLGMPVGDPVYAATGPCALLPGRAGLEPAFARRSRSADGDSASRPPPSGLRSGAARTLVGRDVRRRIGRARTRTAKGATPWAPITGSRTSRATRFRSAS